MFLTHIDEDGNDTPAILIPNSTAANRAVNLPEFVNRDYEEFDAIEVPAANHYIYARKGIDLIDDGKYEEGIAELTRALEEEPEFVQALTAIGWAEVQLGRYDEARARFHRALEIDPGRTIARVNLGFCLIKEKRYEEAADFFRKLVKEAPRSHLAWHNLGVVLINLGKTEEALEAHREAARLAPGDAEILNSLGWALQRTGDRPGAIEAYRSAVRFNPDHQRARSNLISALQADGERAEAHRQMEILLEKRPDDVGLRLGLAWSLATIPDGDLRDGKRAVEIAEECRKLTGDRPDVLDVLAAAYAEAGRFDEAVKTATRALAMAKGKDDRVAGGLEKRLQAYRERRPYRQR
jgi:Flp pilus assembly protein TadD